MIHGSSVVVSGTDTGVGKTVLSALLTLVGGGMYWKPVQAGSEPETDREAVLRMTGLPPECALAEAYVLREPASPDQAAAYEGVRIERARLALPAGSRGMVVEGAGGALVPLSDSLLQADVFRWWALPVVVAVRTGLGTLNHTLLTLEALRTRSVAVCGIVMIGPHHPANARTLENWAGVPLLGHIPPLLSIGPAELAAVYNERFVPLGQWGIGGHAA